MFLYTYVFSLNIDDIPIQNNQGTFDESFDASANLSSITEENNDVKDPSAESAPVKRSLPKIAANFGKKTAEKIATAVKSSGNAKLSKSNTQIGQDIYETDESGIDLAGSDISDSKTGIGHDDRTTMTPLLCRRNPSMPVELESTRSIQVILLHRQPDFSGRFLLLWLIFTQKKIWIFHCL